MSQKKSLLDELLSGVADAVTDIREKVVEEPWFGKTVTQSNTEPSERASASSGWPTAKDVEPSFGSHTHIRDKEPKELPAPEKEYKEELRSGAPTLKELPGWPTQRDAEAERERSRHREQDKGIER